MKKLARQTYEEKYTPVQNYRNLINIYQQAIETSGFSSSTAKTVASAATKDVVHPVDEKSPARRKPRQLLDSAPN